MFGVIFIWFGLSVIVGVAGNTRRQNPIGWFLLAAIISPLLAGLLLLALPKTEPDAGPIRISRSERDRA